MVFTPNKNTLDYSKKKNDRSSFKDEFDPKARSNNLTRLGRVKIKCQIVNQFNAFIKKIKEENFLEDHRWEGRSTLENLFLEIETNKEAIYQENGEINFGIKLPEHLSLNFTIEDNYFEELPPKPRQSRTRR